MLDGGSIISKLTLNASDYFTNLDKAQQAGQNFQNKLDSSSEAVGKAGKSLMLRATAPIVGLGVASVKTGIAFESSMSNIAGIMGLTGKEGEEAMAKLEKSARDAGASTSFSAKDSADALSYMALAGWDVERSTASLLPVLKLAEAGNIDLARASSLTTDTMASMGLGADELDNYLDVLAQTARNSNTDIDQMMEAYLGVGGTLRGLNIDLEDSSVALGMLANAGIKGSEAGTGLNAILLNLSNPTGRAKEAIEELGLEVFDSSGNFIGLTETLVQAKEKMAGMTDEQKNYFISSIAGKEHVGSFNALLNGLDDTYDELSESIGGATGALDEMRDTMKDNQEGSLQNLQSAIEEVGLKVYDILKPAIKEATEFLQSLVDKLNALTPEQQEQIVQIGLLIASIGPLLLILSKIIKVVSFVGGVFMKLGAIIPIVGKAFLFLGSPLGLTVLAIGAVVTIIVKLIKHFQKTDKEAGRFTSIAKLISGAFGTIGRAIKGGIGWLTNWNNKKVKNKEATFTQRVKQIFSKSESKGKGKAKNNAHGTESFSGGWTWVGEQGRELIKLPEKTKILSNQKSEALASSKVEHSGTITVKGVNNQGELVGVVKQVIAKDIADDTRRLPDRPSIIPI